MIGHFNQTHNLAATHTWTTELHNEASCSLDELATNMADSIVQARCTKCFHHYTAWRAAVDDDSAINPSSGIALRAFIRPILGIPTDPKPDDHVQGYVAQFLWYSIRTAAAQDENALRVEMPGYSPTDPGGDGLIVHRQDDNSLMFRLWEIKKASGSSAISSTVSTAYKQLTSRATEYLARFVAIGQEDSDEEISDFFGQLLDLWIDASPHASAGVAISLSTPMMPTRCFTTFGKRFPQFTDPPRLRGVLTALADFAHFATMVKDEVWKGL